MAQPISTKPEGGDPVTPGMARLKFRLQLVAVSDAGQEQIHEVGQFEHEGVAMENPGPHLGEGNVILKNIQERVVQEQIRNERVEYGLGPLFPQAL